MTDEIKQDGKTVLRSEDGMRVTRWCYLVLARLGKECRQK